MTRSSCNLQPYPTLSMVVIFNKLKEPANEIVWLYSFLSERGNDFKKQCVKQGTSVGLIRETQTRDLDHVMLINDTNERVTAKENEITNRIGMHFTKLMDIEYGSEVHHE